MMQGTSATPCPEGPQAYHYRPGNSLLNLAGDDTTDIDFTTEFRASLRAIEPRRRQTAIGAKRRGVAVDFAIHEDQEAQGGHGINLKSSILTKPPQRPGARVIFAHQVKQDSREGVCNKPVPNHGMMRPGPVRPASIVGTSDADPTGAAVSVRAEEVIKRPARRGTVYIPSDDTTMPSMHMGIFSPIKIAQSCQRGGEQDTTVEFTGLAAQMARKRGRRESIAAAPAKRVPLQQPVRITQESTSPRAVPGKRTGKENLPPGHLDALAEVDFEETKLFDLSMPKPTKQRLSALNPVKSVQPSSQFQTDSRFSKGRGPSTTDRNSSFRPSAVSRPNPAARLGEIRKFQNRPSARQIPQKSNQPAPHKFSNPSHQRVSRASREKLPVKLIIPAIPQTQLQQHYPVLSENITEPSMYEESWLTHQEIAITQLVNGLFDTAQGSQAPGDSQERRSNFLEIYQDQTFSLLHKRLKASLLYGALSIPKDVLARAARLWTDLGMRERYCSFWLDTYDLAFLKAGLEVIVGRECSDSPRTSQNGSCASNASKAKTSRRAVRAYLETFMIRNEDGDPKNDQASHEASSYQRTLLRSLLLIKLLDNAKSSPTNPSSLCLFLPTSTHKSSTAVVKALAQMLNPGVGDVLRVLGHLDYFVIHKQYPLEEYRYKIDNLAVDLRDGVKLTRLVELLLYPSASRLLSREQDGDATTTVVMPTGETLSLLQGEHDWPLSQHLTFPCIGRATKLFNVQVALSALTGVRGIENLVKDIQAEDIVDGYREKTVALLWGLSGKWGMAGLIDWNDVRRESRRLSTSGFESLEDDLDETSDEGFEGYKARLKAWASAVARQKGLEVNNLTTSFSDGKVFEAIVDEYEQYLPKSSEDTSQGLPLHDRLVLLGCSVQFAKIFAPTLGCTTGRFFDRDFIVAALAFLCSRLLSTTRRARAAILIQRGWRQGQSRMITQRKRVAKRLAEECVAVVETREKLFRAKGVIIKVWRAHRERSHPGKNHAVSQKDVGSSLDIENSGDVWLSL